MILHNLFFLVLACAVYFAVVSQVEERVSRARGREISLIGQLARSEQPPFHLPGLEIYQYREGTADGLGIPAAVRNALDANPGQMLSHPQQPDLVYFKDPRNHLYRSLRMPFSFYADAVRRTRLALFLVLGVVYCLAVGTLELLIMPRYVYGPLRLMLAADQATRHNETQREIIPESLIFNDEIGQIMRSRNATVLQLRRHEQELEQALQRLEELNQDLQRKNYLLETAKKNIADQDRLVSLGMLSASVAHELNTPLAVLHGSIEKLLETVDSPPAQRRLERMLRVTQRLRRMSESLLDFARVRRQHYELVPLRPLVEEAWSLVGIDEKASEVHFENDTAPDHLVYGNPDRLVQVFVNLLRNALHAVQSGGRIQVMSESLATDGRRWLMVAVEDNGTGIPPDVLPNIFEAFVTSRLDARGTGLGLTVAEGIVHQHGGKITASNRPGGGARLEVTLPAEPLEEPGAPS